MILYPITLLLSFPVVFSYDRLTNFRHRRMPLAQSGSIGVQTTKRNVPFIIRVPYTKIVPSNSLFSHSFSWKAKQTPPPVPIAVAALKSVDDPSTATTAPQTLPDVEVRQFHSQDTNGQVVFGFNAPDQMRIEQRNADGTVHGTYSYLDPYGQVIKRQYWDTGAGFHVTSNTYPLNELSNSNENFRQNVAGGGSVPYTPEVQAARDLHFQLYQQALASFLPNANTAQTQNDLRRNASVPAEEDNALSKPVNDSTAVAASSDAIIVTPSVAVSEDADSSSASSQLSSSSSWTTIATATASQAAQAAATSTSATVNLRDDDESAADEDHGSINIVEPDTENGSIVIQKPEYLRISWTTENKKYRISPAVNVNNHQNDDHWSLKSVIPSTSTNNSTRSASSSDVSNMTRFILQGSK
ncbi:uncharacterized protein LOC135832732 [Planococcus citri]|uniref:uncharacterized protein LOC135832732 n=1 Tax=Planococcus citri TaxID=170843 RepID=UPI0031F73E3E